MNHKGRVAPGCLRAVSWLLIVMVCGCRSATPPPSYMQPERLYLQDRPYSRLYVEVHAMEGVHVLQGWLDELRVFLGEHRGKPDGVTMVRDEPPTNSA